MIGIVTCSVAPEKDIYAGHDLRNVNIHNWRSQNLLENRSLQSFVEPSGLTEDVKCCNRVRSNHHNSTYNCDGNNIKYGESKLQNDNMNKIIIYLLRIKINLL